MKRTLLLTACLVMSPVCPAGNQTGTVNSVNVRASDGLIYFTVNGTKTDAPSCAANAANYWMIKNENSNVGKQQYAMLLAAQATQKRVTVYGSNACTRWLDGEDADQISILQD